MQFRIIKPGLLSTVQDLGRKHYLGQGIPTSGVMDQLSARLANMVVGNDDNAAVIEFTYAGAELLAQTDLLIAYAGDGAVLIEGSSRIPSERPVFIPTGSHIKLIMNEGCRTYLAVAGGWDVPEVLGSRSTYIPGGFGGLDGRALRTGDILSSAGNLNALSEKIWNILKAPSINYPDWNAGRHQLLPLNKNKIRVFPGREFTWFNGSSLVDFLSIPFNLSAQSNRMGYQLEGTLIKRVINKELLSTAVTAGTIQVTNSGKPVLLMADCQTTGGYPRIAQVAAVDLPLCAQLKYGDELRFEEISQNEAEMLYIDREQKLQKLKTAIKSRFL